MTNEQILDYLSKLTSQDKVVYCKCPFCDGKIIIGILHNDNDVAISNHTLPSCKEYNCDPIDFIHKVNNAYTN
jgi:fructose-1,6-bisphosphatase/sedoheptulose 1,7-bisphosphatase-like protein